MRKSLILLAMALSTTVYAAAESVPSYVQMTELSPVQMEDLEKYIPSIVLEYSNANMPVTIKNYADAYITAHTATSNYLRAGGLQTLSSICMKHNEINHYAFKDCMYGDVSSGSRYYIIYRYNQNN